MVVLKMESREWLNSYRQDDSQPKLIDGLSIDAEQLNNSIMKQDNDLVLSASKEHKSRNQKAKYCRNHKTTIPFDCEIGKHFEPIKFNGNLHNYTASYKEQVSNEFDWNNNELKTTYAWSKSKSTNIFDSCIGSVRSKVPQNLISDANRRKEMLNKFSYKQISSGLINNRKLGK